MHFITVTCEVICSTSVLWWQSLKPHSIDQFDGAVDKYLPTFGTNIAHKNFGTISSGLDSTFCWKVKSTVASELDDKGLKSTASRLYSQTIVKE
jgi:hypothetical protein